MTTVHFLKSTPDAYRKVASGEKTLEVRRDDRTPRYKTGDIVVLDHYRPATPQERDGGTWTYQGEHQTRRIGYVERGEHVPAGYCSFALLKPATGDEDLVEQHFVESDADRGRKQRFAFEVSK